MEKHIGRLLSQRNHEHNLGLNWGFVQKIDIQMLQQTRDYDTMQSFVNSFVFSDISQEDARIIQNPISLKLISILKEIIGYMFDCQTELLKMLKRYKDSQKSLKERLKSTKIKLSNSKSQPVIQDFEKCPVCHKKFKGVLYLDKHIEKEHSTHMNAWRSLRINSPLTPKEDIEALVNEIETLKNTIYLQTKQFNRTLANFQNHAKAIEKHDSEKANTTPTIDYVDFSLKKSNTQWNTKKASYTAFQPKIVTIKNDVVLESTDSESDADFEITNRLSKQVKQERKRLQMGFSANYLTPKQVSTTLDYQNDLYRSIKHAARKQLQADNPLPSTKKPEEQKSTFSDTENSSLTKASSKDNASSESANKTNSSEKKSKSDFVSEESSKHSKKSSSKGGKTNGSDFFRA